MKKIYLLSIMLIACVTMFAADADRIKVVFTHGSTVTQEFNHNGWWSAGGVAYGETINVTGSYDLAADGHDVTGISIVLTEMLGWGAVESYNIYRQGGDSGNDLTGTFNYDMVIPANIKLSADIPAGPGNLYLVQVRVVYGDASAKPAGQVDTYVNCAPLITEGDVPDGEISLKFNDGAATIHNGTFNGLGTLSTDDEIVIDGTFTAQHLGSNATSVTMKISEFTSTWGAVATHHTFDAISLTPGTTALNETITIPSGIPSTSSLDPGNFLLLQVIVNYGSATRYANAALTIENTSTDIATNLDTDINVYPNPVAVGGIINVSGMAFTSDVKIELVNIAGSIVKSITTSSNKASINADVAPGLYTLCISSGNNKTVKKVIIK